MPTPSTYERKYPSTGFWLFICNTRFWNADAWLGLGETELLYKISDHHRTDMAAGQLGLLRLNKDVRSRTKRGGRPPHDAGIYAVVEVAGIPAFRSDPDIRAYNSADDAAKPAWRVPIRVVANLLHAPVLASSLPDDEEFQHIHLPLNTSTLAMKPTAVRRILSMANVLHLLGPKSSQPDKELAETITGIQQLEQAAAAATPERKERISRYVERGSIGRSVKQLRGGRCQLCEASGRDAVAFFDRKGRPYSEAHHVVPVSTLAPGSLSHLNIMVLCPNHHRQVHLGKFEVLTDTATAWSVDLDGKRYAIAKPVVPPR